MERIKKLIVVILCVGMISSLNISFIYASQSNGYHPLNIKIESPDVPKTVTPKRNARSLDSYYSSSELGQVTSVKDQGNTELCWAFGITSMGETSLIKQGIASTNVDFSEKHFGYFMYNRKNDILNNTKGDKTKVSGDWRFIFIRNIGISVTSFLISPTVFYNPCSISGRSGSTVKIISAITIIPSNDRNCNSARQAANHIVAIVGWDEVLLKSIFHFHRIEMQK